MPKCWPWTHDWPRWTDVHAVKLLGRETGELPIGRAISQERRCQRCGKVQLRTVTTYYS